MNQMSTSGPDDLGWADVEACTLPTVERPLRVAEFDDLFTAVVAIERSGDNHVRLLLTGDAPLADRTRHLANAESSCCSFFTFSVSRVGDGLVGLDIDVPAAYADVLAGLVARAELARSEAL